MYDYYLFDLDGTITEPGLGITNSVMYALKKYGIEETDRNKLYKFIGPPLRVSFQEFYGFSPEQAEEATSLYREYYRETGIFECELYEGIPELIKELKARGKKVLLATSKPEEFSIRLLEHFGLLEYFDFVSAATMDSTRDSKSKVIAYALAQYPDADRSTMVMIGDRKFDIEGAKDHSLDSIGVLFGYGSKEEFEAAGATYMVEKALDILNI